MERFGKKDLKTGDFVVLRNGLVGIVIAEKSAIIYQTAGYDDIDCLFNDDLTSSDAEEAFDIVKVYRGPYDSVISFIDYDDDGDLIFEATA